jgi:hypothetical protein
MLKLIFLLSLVITTALTAMQFTGYQVLDLVIIMIIIDFISLGASIELERRKSDKETKGFITTKLEGIENICKDIFSHITSPNPGFEAKLEKQKNDMSYILDKIAKKSLELEEKLNIFGRVLTNDSKEKIEISEEAVEEEQKEEEKPAESFNVGEIMYVEEEGQE